MFEQLSVDEHMLKANNALGRMSHLADDRVVAIVAAAYLDDCLLRLIKAAMPNLTKKLIERLFDQEGPLSTLSAKIDLAAAMGLVTSDERSDYIIIARIRNRMAHLTEVDQMSHSEIKGLIKKIKMPYIKPGLNDLYAPKSEERLNFDWTVIPILIGITNNIASRVVHKSKIDRKINSTRSLAEKR